MRIDRCNNIGDFRSKARRRRRGRCVATATMDANLLREMTTSPTAEAVIQG